MSAPIRLYFDTDEYEDPFGFWDVYGLDYYGKSDLIETEDGLISAIMLAETLADEDGYTRIDIRRSA